MSSSVSFYGSRVFQINYTTGALSSLTSTLGPIHNIAFDGVSER